MFHRFVVVSPVTGRGSSQFGHLVLIDHVVIISQETHEYLLIVRMFLFLAFLHDVLLLFPVESVFFHVFQRDLFEFMDTSRFHNGLVFLLLEQECLD